MDILSVLSGIKGKVLDAAHYDLLHHAYELQQRNIEQLNQNNQAIAENNGLLKERIHRLEQETGRLRGENQRLQKEADVQAATQSNAADLSEIERALLRLYRQADEASLCEYFMYSRLKHSRIEIKSALSDLSKRKVMRAASFHPDEGACYSLTDAGKKLCLTLE